MEKLWPEACSNSEDVQEDMVIQNFVELAGEVGLDGMNKDDSEELLQSMAGPTSDKLREIAEQCIQSEFTSSDAEQGTPVRELSTEFLSNSITAITQILDQFIDNGLGYERVGLFGMTVTVNT
jgi:hypothetical protein